MSVLAALLVAAAVAIVLPVIPTSRLRNEPDSIVAAVVQPDESRVRSPLATAAASTAVGLAIWVFVGGWLGGVLGAVAAALAFRVLGSLAAPDQAAAEDQLAAQAADMADMLGACVASGAPLARATAQVALAIEAPAQELLAEAAARQALGAHPGVAWAQLSQHESTAPIARAIIRSLESGAPMADALTSCASELRDIRRARIEAMAQSVAVKSVGPLGLCFLPAFLLIGVVPLVAGLIEESIDLF